jgi:nitroreductase
MELIDIIKERKSIRAFKADTIPRETVAEIITIAAKAPSAINLQPWELTVVMNEERERLSRRLLKAYREKQISCSPGNVKPMPAPFSARGVESFESMKPHLDGVGIDFNTFVNEGSCNFYGAPAAVIISMDDCFSAGRSIDIGIFLAYLMLAAHNIGIWTCPIGLICAYEDEVKDALNIPDSKRIIIGVAMGYPDPDHPINRFVSPREEPAKMVRWFD